MRRSVVVVIALALVAALVLGAAATVVVLVVGRSTTGTSSSPSSRTAAPSPRSSAAMPSPDPGLARFEDQTLDWSTCASQRLLQCARLRVPLDYTHPQGRTITLALLKVSAGDPQQKVGSLVVNPGGPGAPGTTYAAAAASAFGATVRQHFDIVGFDPRGTEGSEPIDCLSDDDLDTYLAGDADPDTPAEQTAYVAAIEAFNRGCVARSGAMAAHVSTVEAARDMDVLRAALGEPRLDYFGASYGTKLGATYAQLFPTRVGRMVLDGAVTLDSSREQSDLANAVGFQTALDAYLQHCVDQDDCFLGDTVTAAQDRLERFLTDVDATPLDTSSGRQLTGGLALYGVLLALYSRDYWNVLSVGLKQAFGGDGSTLLSLADAINSRGPDGYTDNLQEAIVDINCLDDPTVVSPATIRASLPEFERASPVFGRALAWSGSACAGFTPRASQPPPDNHAEGAPPLLVIGTTRDPATPYAWAQEMAERLSSAVLISRDGDGHTGYHAGNSCVDRTVEDYLVDGTVPSGPVSC